MALILAGVLLAATASGAQSKGPIKIGDKLEVSPLLELARELRDAGYRERIEFAIVALQEMTSMYREEAMAVHPAQAVDRDQRNHYARWRWSTLEYAETLERINGFIRADSNVEILIDPQNTLRLLVDRRPVIVVGPRLDQPNHLSQRIIDRFCHVKECRGIEDNRPPQAPDEIDSVSAIWSFEQGRQPTLYTRDGLSFTFSTAEGLD